MNRQPQRSSELLRLAIDDYPADDSLRLDFLRGAFSELANDKAPPEIVEVAAKLNPRPASILAAARHAARNEWRDVAMADSQLADIPWTDVWYAEALELRVNWRIRITGDKERKRFGDEAIMMIDRCRPSWAPVTAPARLSSTRKNGSSTARPKTSSIRVKKEK